MQRPWRAYEPFDFEPVELSALSTPAFQSLLSYTIEFLSLGFEHTGDYRLHSGWEMQTVRFYRSVDGAVLGWMSDKAGQRTFSFASILEDGTLVQSTPHKPVAPWSCCRFPVHVNFGSGCSLEDLLVLHLNRLIDLEPGCGPAIKYERSDLRNVVLYMQMLVHETLHGQGAPAEALPIPQAEPVRELAVH